MSCECEERERDAQPVTVQPPISPYFKTQIFLLTVIAAELALTLLGLNG